MPDWFDKYTGDAPGVAVDQTAPENNWYDKYLEKPKPKQAEKVSRKFGPLPGMSFNLSPDRAESFDSAGRLGRDIGNSVALQAVSGPTTLINMLGQGAYGAGSHIYDVSKEKGLSGVDADDLKHAAVKGGISSLGPLIGRAISPAVPMQPKGPIEGISHWVAKNKGMEHVPDEFVEEIARAGRSGIFKPFVGKEMHDTVPHLVQKGAEALANNAMPMAVGAMAGHTLMNAPILGALAGVGLTHAKDIATKGIPAWWNNMAMHTGTAGPMFQSVLNQLSREGGDIAADTIKY